MANLHGGWLTVEAVRATERAFASVRFETYPVRAYVADVSPCAGFGPGVRKVMVAGTFDEAVRKANFALLRREWKL